MKRSKAWLGPVALLSLVVGGLALFALETIDRSAAFKSKFEGSCTPVAGIAGPEDMQIDPATRRAYISSFEREGRQRARGGVFVFSIDDPLADDAWRDRTQGAPSRFEPMGLHFYESGEVRRLFVVNAAADSVELYDVARDGDLAYLETFTERRLTSPNDVVAVGPRAFYVTNDLAPGRNSPLGRLQRLLRTGSGRVLYFDGVAWKAAADGLRFANGIALNADGRRLYVAETTGRALRIFDRDTATGALEQAQIVPFVAAPDSINVDLTGSLWIGAHGGASWNPLDRGTGSGARHPSMVIRYEDMGGAPSRPTPVFTDDGATISAATVAARLGPTLLIGGSKDKKFLICNLP